ncbi:hypothetical protein PR001_g1716 [Phytophthora rubi]|uniref:Uncharacterized protein n=1 Tax=Phytophthora rubi TaxID=129364 RepID=A0A6A3NX11_9STRA|nr:hypothetical protein PR002_g1900 [Phytophthora rubi]KAE9051150.1 hypothetical protein PR001_g1716 [Phytophthora rubi]
MRARPILSTCASGSTASSSSTKMCLMKILSARFPSTCAGLKGSGRSLVSTFATTTSNTWVFQVAQLPKAPSHDLSRTRETPPIASKS